MSLEHTLESINIHELSLAQMRVTRSNEQLNQSLAKGSGMTTTEWLMLSSIAEYSPHGIRVTDLAHVFDVKTTYVTSVLNSLRAKSYIDTRFDPNDARVRLAIISKTGAKQLSHIEHAARQAIAERLEGVIPARDFERYISVLIRLAKI